MIFKNISNKNEILKNERKISNYIFFKTIQFLSEIFFNVHFQILI